MDKLRLDINKGEIRTYEVSGKKLTCKAWSGITYCEHPADEIQKLNIFMPQGYDTGETINGYSRDTAPIFVPNTVGGYKEGPADEPGYNEKTKMANAVFAGLEHGYIVVSGGVRGRTSGAHGKAPAFIVDMKAIIRYIRHNRGIIPGDTEHIITNGTSAGGALSALAGASGNSTDFEDYLAEIGAADERDDIFAASCYCPIHNLEHADAAYEWQFEGIRDYHRTSHQITEDGELTDQQMVLSKQLKELFITYINDLELRDDKGALLSLDAAGEGSFLDYVKKHISDSAQRELIQRDTRNRWAEITARDSEPENNPAVVIQDHTVSEVDWNAYVKAITRMKPAPAFDATDLSCPENEEFGSADISARHFTEFSMAHSEVEAEMAPEQLIKMINPLTYIGKAETAKYWRIRHGASDRDTSFAIPVILELLLKRQGCDVDFFLPWGIPHSGDYDLEELFAWIDKICC